MGYPIFRFLCTLNFFHRFFRKCLAGYFDVPLKTFLKG